jgi:hypothetical protein
MDVSNPDLVVSDGIAALLSGVRLHQETHRGRRCQRNPRNLQRHPQLRSGRSVVVLTETLRNLPSRHPPTRQPRALQEVGLGMKTPKPVISNRWSFA